MMKTTYRVCLGLGSSFPLRLTCREVLYFCGGDRINLLVGLQVDSLPLFGISGTKPVSGVPTTLGG